MTIRYWQDLLVVTLISVNLVTLPPPDQFGFIAIRCFPIPSYYSLSRMALQTKDTKSYFVRVDTMITKHLHSGLGADALDFGFERPRHEFGDLAQIVSSRQIHLARMNSI